MMFLTVLKYIIGGVFVLLSIFILLKSIISFFKSIKDLKKSKKEDNQV